jgi:hypothetical protein
MKEKALADLKKMTEDAQEILSALEAIKSGIESGDAQAIRDGLDGIAEHTYSYSSGIVGFQPRTTTIEDLAGRLEGASDANCELSNAAPRCTCDGRHPHDITCPRSGAKTLLRAGGVL